MTNFLVQLRRRKLGQWALAYLAGGWVLLQVFDLVGHQFDWPAALLRGTTLIFAIGFFAVLVVAWYHGERGAQRISGIELLILALLLAICGGLLWWLAPASRVAHSQSIVVHAIASDRQSIAVLPFANMSDDKEQGYFSDGLAEELLDLLAKVPQLRVVGRTSSFSFKGKNTSLAEIGRQLNVATVLEGSVRKSGERLRVTTKLLNAADGVELWSETYDRQLTDVFAVQDDIANAVIQSLKIKLLPQQRTAIATHRTENVEAYDQYLLGRQYYDRSSPESWRMAVDAYEKAIAIDPNFAAAYAELAIAKVYASQSADSPAAAQEDQRNASIAAEQAIALDPGLAEAYTARGVVRIISKLDWSGAEADYKQGLLLDPLDSTLLRRYALLFVGLGRLPEAMEMTRKAIARDPLSSSSWNNLGYQSNAAGQLAAARQALNRSIALNPQSPYANYNLGITCLLEENPSAALVLFERIPPTHFLRWTGVAVAEHDLGRAELSQQALDMLTAMRSAPPFWIAAVHAWRGESDQAFAWLERAYAQRDVFLQNIKVDPLLRKLRGDPRYAAIVKKVGLPP